MALLTQEILRFREGARLVVIHAVDVHHLVVVAVYEVLLRSGVCKACDHHQAQGRQEYG